MSRCHILFSGFGARTPSPAFSVKEFVPIELEEPHAFTVQGATRSRTMAKKSGRRRRKGPKASPLVVSKNFVLNAGPGCYIARRDVSNSWMLEWEDDVDPNDFDGQEVPDVALDPQDRTITLCNVSDAYRVDYVTIYETTIREACVEKGQKHCLWWYRRTLC